MTNRAYHTRDKRDRARLWLALEAKDFYEGHNIEFLHKEINSLLRVYLIDRAGVVVSPDEQGFEVHIFGLEEEIERTKFALEEMARIKLEDGRVPPTQT